MGIYDRDYYRSQGRFLEAFALRGSTTRLLILVNVVAYILQLVIGEPFTRALQLDTDKVLQGQVWRLLTCAFLHDPGVIMHIVFNMWFLWIFGGDVEDVYGKREFLAFYLMAALIASLAFMLQSLFVGPGIMLGASGAVTAVLVLCACHFPNRTILLFFVLPVPIWALAVFQVLQDTIGLFGRDSGIAVAAHLGGAAFGFVYYKKQWRVLNLFSALGALRAPRSKPTFRMYGEEPERRETVAVAAPSGPDIDEQFEAKVDAVLEKVARHGQHSLSEAEKGILLRASEIYKKRRT